MRCTNMIWLKGACFAVWLRKKNLMFFDILTILLGIPKFYHSSTVLNFNKFFSIIFQLFLVRAHRSERAQQDLLISQRKSDLKKWGSPLFFFKCCLRALLIISMMRSRKYLLASSWSKYLSEFVFLHIWHSLIPLTRSKQSFVFIYPD